MTDPWPFKVIDEETDPPVMVCSYDTLEKAEFFIDHLRKHGGTVTRAKVDRGGYGIDGPSK